jgi:hypothetical protein
MKPSHIAVLSAVFAAATHHAIAGTAVPPDLAIRAQFFPGGGGEWMIPEMAAKLPKPWTARISADGKASQATTFVTDPRRSLPTLMRPGKNDPPISTKEMRAVDSPRVKRLQVGQQKLQQIVQAIRTAEFFALPQELSSPLGFHTASVVLHITMDGRTRQVAFEWPNERFDRPGLLRFWTVWSAVTRAIPSPNHNDELDYWTHAVGLRLPRQI